MGVEPTTKRLRVSCSTTELQTQLFSSGWGVCFEFEGMQAECATHCERSGGRRVGEAREVHPAPPGLALPNHRPLFRSRVGVPLSSGIRRRVALEAAYAKSVRPPWGGLGVLGNEWKPWDVREVIPLKSGTPTPVRTFYRHQCSHRPADALAATACLTDPAPLPTSGLVSCVFQSRVSRAAAPYAAKLSPHEQVTTAFGSSP